MEAIEGLISISQAVIKVADMVADYAAISGYGKELVEYLRTAKAALAALPKFRKVSPPILERVHVKLGNLKGLLERIASKGAMVKFFHRRSIQVEIQRTQGELDRYFTLLVAASCPEQAYPPRIPVTSDGEAASSIAREHLAVLHRAANAMTEADLQAALQCVDANDAAQAAPATASLIRMAHSRMREAVARGNAAVEEAMDRLAFAQHQLSHTLQHELVRTEERLTAEFSTLSVKELIGSEFRLQTADLLEVVADAIANARGELVPPEQLDGSVPLDGTALVRAFQRALSSGMAIALCPAKGVPLTGEVPGSQPFELLPCGHHVCEAVCTELFPAHTGVAARHGCPVCGEMVVGATLAPDVAQRARVLRGVQRSPLLLPPLIDPDDLVEEDAEDSLFAGGEGSVAAWLWRTPNGAGGARGLPVAVKCIEVQPRGGHRARLMEMLALHQLAGIAAPGVGRLYGHFFKLHRKKEFLYIVMERLDCSLEDKVAEANQGADFDSLVRPMADTEVARTALSIARTLNALHNSLCVWHLDVTPGNIMFDATGAPRLIDFGLARRASTSKTSLTATFLGTPGFAAPEVAGAAGPGASDRANGRVRAVSDVYGLGQCMVVMALGDLLTEPAPPAVRTARSAAWKGEGPHAVDTDLAALANAMRAADPAARPSMQRVVQVLETIRQRPTGLARPPVPDALHGAGLRAGQNAVNQTAHAVARLQVTSTGYSSSNSEASWATAQRVPLGSVSPRPAARNASPAAGGLHVYALQKPRPRTEACSGPVRHRSCSTGPAERLAPGQPYIPLQPHARDGSLPAFEPCSSSATARGPSGKPLQPLQAPLEPPASSWRPAGTASVSNIATFVTDRLDKLEEALDAMRRAGTLLCGRYEILDATDRRRGGQGCVQFVFDRQTRVECVVKFFFARRHFDHERTLYADPALRSAMAATRDVCANDDGGIKAVNGAILPPFIVLERGESLDEFQQLQIPAIGAQHSRRIDIVTVAQAMLHTAACVAALHQLGWVHRDLKPGNVLRVPRSHTWTLIDFGSAARIGQEAPIEFTPAYAAPEVARAHVARLPTIVACPAMDVWALGLIAYELLTGERPFRVGAPEEEIFAVLSGQGRLPWEGANIDPAVAARLSKLGMFKRGVLQCLERDPAQRPALASVLASWQHVFTATSSHARQ